MSEIEVKIPPIEQVFPGLMKELYFSSPEYMELFKGLNIELILTHRLGSYQGSSWVLFRSYHEHRQVMYGFLEFGWGSCSGCDALAACDSYKDLDKLRRSLINSISWFTISKMVKFLKEKDWESMSDSSVEEGKTFINKVLPLLLTSEELKTMEVLEN